MTTSGLDDTTRPAVAGQPGAVRSPWWTVGVTMFIGLFVAYLDRSALSVGLTELAAEFGFSGASFAVVSSIALTIFNVGYAIANIVGGFATRRFDPRHVVITTLLVWSVAVVLTGLVNSIVVVVAFRGLLGIAEGVYWPQQSRIVTTWFHERHLSRANSVVQFYGQYISLAVGFPLLAWLNTTFGWRSMFIAVGAVGLFVALPLFWRNLRRPPTSPARPAVEEEPTARPVTVRLASFGGPRFLLLLASSVTQGMFFWGLTLWLPQAVKDLGFTGLGQGLASGLPYLAAVLLAIPATMVSDRTGKRTLIASIGLFGAGVLLVLLAFAESPAAKLVLITLAMAYFAALYTPNSWSIIQSTVDRSVVGAASGLFNGFGAGIGGAAAGWLVGLLKDATGSYLPGFTALGVIAVVGALCMYVYGRLVDAARAKEPQAS